MRFSFPTLIRTLYAFSNATSRTSPRTFSALSRPTVLRSMPTIPFIGSLFSSSSTRNMSYPVQKSDDEWQAVLSKGKHPPPPPPGNPTSSQTTNEIAC